jgi:ABC-type nitrate/sulfonate/bicarbonate transport system ATPase subunit
VVCRPVPVDQGEASIRAPRAEEIRGHVGMAFQQFNLFPHKSASGNVTLALIKARKMNARRARVRWTHLTAWAWPIALGRFSANPQNERTRQFPHRVPAH